MTQKNINPLHKIYGTLKSTASKAAGKIAGNKTELTMRFYKEGFLWYADVNGWPGPKEHVAYGRWCGCFFRLFVGKW